MLMDRRRFCVSSAAAAAGLAAAGLTAARAGSLVAGDPGFRGAPTPALHKVIFDSRFPASRAFGESAAGAGRATAAIQGDVTALWFHDLRPQWARGRAAVAGMTTMRSLFCLQQLAHDHWMRVIISAVHGLPAAAAAAGRVRRMVGNIEDLAAPPAEPRPASADPQLASADSRLVSWVIAAG